MTTRNKLKILQIHWGFPPTIGGVETHLTILLPELVKQGHEVTLLTGAVEGEKDDSIYEGVKIKRSPLFDLNWLVKRGLNGLAPDLEKIYGEVFASTSFDIVHTHNMHYFSNAHIKILEEYCEKRKIPLLLTAHNVWDDNQFLHLTRDVNWSHIIAVSHYIRRELHGVGISDTKTTTIHHGLNLTKYSLRKRSKKMLQKYPMLKGKKVVFHPARMGLAKGCDISIKAMRVVLERHPDAMLVLAGSKNIIDWGLTQEKDVAYFIDLIRGLGLTDNVLIDVFSLAEMPDMYRVSDVVLYPSSASEPFGLAMIEAFASARPIIVTDMGGMPEIVQNDISGYVIHQKDHEALASRIISLLDNENLRRRLGTTGRSLAEQHYNRMIMTRNHLRVYGQVLRERQKVVRKKRPARNHHPRTTLTAGTA